MDQLVPHACHIVPGNLRVPGPRVWRDVLCRFTDNFDALDCCKTGFFIVPKLFECDPFCKAFYAEDVLSNILKRSGYFSLVPSQEDRLFEDGVLKLPLGYLPGVRHRL